MTNREKYFEIINNRKAHPLADGVFGEIHHIIPRSLGGSDDEENLVKLTAQEHYDCHELLPFIYLEEGNQEGYDKMMYAWNQICHTREGLVINAQQYAELRERYAVMHSEALKGKNNPNYGKTPSDETKKKLSEAMKGKNNPMFGKNAFEGKTDEEMAIIKQKMSEAKKGKNNPMFGKPSPMKGKKHSDDTKKKISETLSKPFDIDNIRFETLRDAAMHFGVGITTICRWLNNPEKYPDHICKYLCEN